MVRYYVMPVPSPYTVILFSYSKIWPIMQLVLASFAFAGVSWGFPCLCRGFSKSIIIYGHHWFGEFKQ